MTASTYQPYEDKIDVKAVINETAKWGKPFAYAADIYAARGWPVLPVEGKGKIPSGYTGYGGEDATDAQRAEWVERRSGHNIAARMLARVIGLDVDDYTKDGKVKEGAKQLAALEARYGKLPATWTSTSRGGGQPSRIHFYRVPEGTRLAQKPADDIEAIQRHHRYAVVWPSVHPDTGAEYTWYRPDGSRADGPPAVDELPELPAAWLAGLTAPERNEARGVEALDDAREPEGEPCEGMAATRDYWLAQFDDTDEFRHDLARNAQRAIVADALKGHRGVWAALDAVRARFLSERDDEPYWDRTLANVPNKDDGLMTELEWCRCDDDVTQDDPADEEEYDLSALMEVEFPPLKWVAEPLLPEGAGLMVAPPKIGKSFMSLQLGLDVATGSAFLDRYVVDQGDVLYLALEDGPRRAQSRAKMLLSNRQVAPGRFTLWLTAPRISEGLEDKLTHWVDQHPDARLVIIDVLQKVRPSAHGGSGGDRYKEDYEALGALQKLSRRLDVGMLVVHHTRKSESRDEVDQVSGSNGVAGAVDYLVKIERDRNKTEGTVYVTGRDTDEAKFSAEFHGRWSRTDYPAALVNEAVGSARRKVYDFLSEHIGGEFRAGDIASRTDISVRSVRDALGWLEKRGVVETSGTGKRGDAAKYRVSPDAEDASDILPAAA